MLGMVSGEKGDSVSIFSHTQTYVRKMLYKNTHADTHMHTVKY